MGQLEENKVLKKSFSPEFIRGLTQKPLSLIAALVAIGILSLSLFNLIAGNRYISQLNYVDATTLIMIGILILRALTKFYLKSDIETASIALISSLSFVFGYEAIYKWSFYILPWEIPAPELRELILQIGVGLVILSGFAQQVFRLQRVNVILLSIFIFSWLFWLAIGFPQLWDGINIHETFINLSLNRNMIYLLNRFTKVLWFMFHYMLYA